MSDDPSFEEMQASAVVLAATVDQFVTACRPMFSALVVWEQACLNAGMSEQASALFTMRLASSFNWPVPS